MYLVAFTLDCALMLGFTPAPFFIYDFLDGGAGMSGVISALQFGLYAVACLVASPFVTRAKDGLKLALIGLLGYGLLFPASIIVKTPLFFGGVSTLGFACMSLVWPAVQSWMGGERDPKKRKRRLTVFNVCWTSGLAAGALLAGRLYDIDYRLPFCTVMLLAGVAWVLIATMPHEKAYHRVDTTPGEVSAVERERPSPYLWSAWLANLVGCALIGSSRAVFTKRVDELVAEGTLVVFSDSFPLETLASRAATQFSWLAFALCMARAVTFAFQGRTHSWQDRLWVITVFQLLAAAAFWVLGMTHSLAVMVLCYLMAGINGGVAYFASMHYSLNEAAHKHRRSSVHEAMVGLGNFTGCFAFGILAERFGTVWPFLYTPVFILGAVGLQYTLLAVSKARQPAVTGTAPDDG